MNRSHDDPEAIADENVAQLIVDQLDQVGDRPALIRLDARGTTDQVITHERLNHLVGACAGGLRARGIRRGSKVVVFVPMSIELYITMLAVFRLGAVATFIEPWGGRRVVDQAAQILDADAFVGIPKSFVLRMMSPALRNIDVAIATGARRVPGAERFNELLDASRHAPVHSPARMTEGEAAMVTITTAADGAPIGVIHSHDVLRAQHHALERLAVDATEARVWTDVPLVALHTLLRGGAVIVPPDGLGQDPMPDPRRFHQLIARSGATILALSSGPLGQIARAPGRASLTGVHHVYTCGRAATPELLEAVQGVVPNAKMTTLYGSAETMPVALAGAREVLERRDALRTHGGTYVGVPGTDVDVKVIRTVRGPILLEPGTSLDDWCVADRAPGELIVAASHVTHGYWPDADAERTNTITDEHGRMWRRTGDVVRRERDGGIWLLGRRGTGWTMRGRHWWSLEIETPVMDLPEVERAAICMPKFEGSAREFKNATAVLAVEPTHGFTRRDATQATVRVLHRLGVAEQIEVRSLKRIPVDKRRVSEVNLAALQEKLKPENNDDY